MNDVSKSTEKAIVLVHGGFVDGSGWEEVYYILKKDGFRVSIVLNPTISLADGVALSYRVLASHYDPEFLVGHSYGVDVFSEHGAEPQVSRFFYIYTFAIV